MKLKLLSYSVLSGILFFLAWTTFGLGPILFVAFIPMLFVDDYIFENSDRLKSINIFYYTYLTFITWNLLATWWVYNSTVEGGLMAFILNSLFYAVLFWVIHIIKRRLGRRVGYFALLVIWLAWEYLYVHGEISWVWLVLGNGFAQNTSIVQWYEYTGTLGGSFWVLIVNIILYNIIKHILTYKTIYGQILNSIILLIIIAIPISYSLYTYNTYTEKENPIKVGIIQPNIDPYGEKFGGMSNYQQLSLMLNLADSIIDDNTDYIVGPETAINDNIWENNIYKSRSIARIDSFVKVHPKAQFVIGATTRYMYENGNPSVTSRAYGDELRYDLYNTALQISNDNIDIYHKSMLVIGVEMFPYPKYLSFLTDMAIELGGTSGSYGTQPERVAFSNGKNKGKVAPVICYESIYGEFVTGYIKKGANVIFVVTNDGWWGDTPGYKQHLSFSKLRAIETRRSIVRSANTGISCFINQRGDILQPTKYWVKDAIKGIVNLNDEQTFYVKNGDFIGRIASFVALLLLLMLLVKSIKPEVYSKK